MYVSRPRFDMLPLRSALFLVVTCFSAGVPAQPHGFDAAVAGLGSPAPGQASRLVHIDEQSTRQIIVEHFEAVTITNTRGASFTWRFDTGRVPTGFPLRRVAPPGFDSGAVWVYVDQARIPAP